MSDVYPSVGLDLGAVLVPGSPDVLVRHLALKERLVLGLHREVGDALVDLQLFFYTSRRKYGGSEESLPLFNRMLERTNHVIQISYRRII